MLPQLRRKEKDDEKLEISLTKKLLARYRFIFDIKFNLKFNTYQKGIMVCRCYLKLGRWQEELQGLTECSITSVLECYSSATTHDPSWYKAWHSWAYMNFETVLFYKNQQNKLQSNEQTGEKGISVKASSEVIQLICYSVFVIL